MSRCTTQRVIRTRRGTWISALRLQTMCCGSIRSRPAREVGERPKAQSERRIVRRSCHTPPVPTHSLLELTLFVSDVDESAAFYRAMGVTLFNDDQPGRPHVVDGLIGRTGAVLQLFPAGERPSTKVQLGFRVSDVAAVAAALARLGVGYEIPGVRRLRTTDPNGNRVHLTDVIR